jgi:hypothetical protein
MEYNIYPCLAKTTIPIAFLLIFIHLRCGGNLNLNFFDDEKIDKNNPIFLKCKIG